MQLTLYTDYSLRVLIYLGARPAETVTISEIARSYGISRNHLVKVVHNLAGHGFIHTTRGKGGGLRLARPAAEINLGDVIRHTEGGFDLVECMKENDTSCPIHEICRLRGVVGEALTAFTDVWGRYTLADIVGNRDQLNEVLVAFPTLRRP